MAVKCRRLHLDIKRSRPRYAALHGSVICPAGLTGEHSRATLLVTPEVGHVHTAAVDSQFSEMSAIHVRRRELKIFKIDQLSPRDNTFF